MIKRGMKPKRAAEIKAKKGLVITKLQKLRLARGFSQSELANAAGVSVRRIQKYEQQLTPIEGARLDTLCDLCIALDCKIEDVIENETIIKKICMVK